MKSSPTVRAIQLKSVQHSAVYGPTQCHNHNVYNVVKNAIWQNNKSERCKTELLSFPQSILKVCWKSAIQVSIPTMHFLQKELPVEWLIITGWEKPGFLKKPKPTGFLGFWALLGFVRLFYLNEQLGSLLLDLAHQLSFYLDSTALFKILANSLLIGRSCKHKEMFNYY